MKENITNNIQTGTWSHGLGKNHVERGFLAKGKESYDTNPDIDPRFTTLNRYSDGKNYIQNGNIGLHRYKSRNSHHMKHMRDLRQALANHVQDYIKVHNSKPSVKSHPTRKINSYKDLLRGRRNKRSHTRPTLERTGVLTYGSAKSNYQNIKLIQKAYPKLSYMDARKRYSRVLRQSLIKSLKTIGKDCPNLHIANYGVNVDEDRDPSQVKSNEPIPDAMHIHYSVIGFGYSRLDKHGKPVANVKIKRHGHVVGKIPKPTFNFDKALEMDFHTNSAKTAWHQFRTREDTMTLNTVHRGLKNKFKRVPQFKQAFVLTRTNSMNTGRNMKLYKHDVKMADKANRKVARKYRNRIRRLKYRANQIKSQNNRADRRHNQQKGNRKQYRINNRSYSAKASTLSSQVASLSTKDSITNSHFSYDKSIASSYTSSVDNSFASVQNSYTYASQGYSLKNLQAQQKISSANSQLSSVSSTASAGTYYYSSQISSASSLASSINNNASSAISNFTQSQETAIRPIRQLFSSMKSTVPSLANTLDSKENCSKRLSVLNNKLRDDAIANYSPVNVNAMMENLTNNHERYYVYNDLHVIEPLKQTKITDPQQNKNKKNAISIGKTYAHSFTTIFKTREYLSHIKTRIAIRFDSLSKRFKNKAKAFNNYFHVKFHDYLKQSTQNIVQWWHKNEPDYFKKLTIKNGEIPIGKDVSVIVKKYDDTVHNDRIKLNGVLNPKPKHKLTFSEKSDFTMNYGFLGIGLNDIKKGYNLEFKPMADPAYFKQKGVNEIINGLNGLSKLKEKYPSYYHDYINHKGYKSKIVRKDRIKFCLKNKQSYQNLSHNISVNQQHNQQHNYQIKYKHGINPGGR